MSNEILVQLAALDPVPNVDDVRFTHSDLSARDETLLVREIAWLRTRNFLLPSEWHSWRESAVASELRRRRDLRNQRHGRGAA